MLFFFLFCITMTNEKGEERERDSCTMTEKGRQKDGKIQKSKQ